VPGPLYLDASALLKVYVPETGSSELNDVIAGRLDLIVSDLTLTEIVSALARRLRAGALPREAVGRVQQSIASRVDEGVLQRVELTRAVHRRAEHLLVTLDATPLRAADALHLALAQAGRAASMATYDARLAAAARGAGLVVHPESV
jgi:predicted nucleic acid-binding protein